MVEPLKTTSNNTPKGASKSTQAARRQATQAAILQAGLTEFAAHGFDSARVSDIAVRAGVAEGTVFLHFGNKRGLFHATTRINYDQMIADAADILAGPESAMDRLKAVTRNHLQVLERNWRVVVSLLGPNAFQGDSLHDREFYECNRIYRQMFRDHIQEMKDAEQLRAAVNPDILRDTIFGSLEYFATGHFGTDRPYDLDRYLDDLWQVILPAPVDQTVPAGQAMAGVRNDDLNVKLDRILTILTDGQGRDD